MAIASSSPLKNINQVTSEIGIDHYFDVKVSGEAFKHSKPNPEIYLYTADKLQINVNQCVAVEDSTYGIRAALNAKIKVIAKKMTDMDMTRHWQILLLKILMNYRK